MEPFKLIINLWKELEIRKRSVVLTSTQLELS
jgi:hypothetical protein